MTAIAAVDDRYVGVTRHNPRRSRETVAYHDEVGVIRHHSRGIGNGLALCYRRRVRIGKPQRSSVQPLHRALKRQPGSRARLVKQRRQELALTKARPCRQIRPHLICQSKNLANLKIR